MRAPTILVGVLLVLGLTVPACKRGAGTQSDPSGKLAADPDCVPPEEMPAWARKVSVSQCIEWLSSSDPGKRLNGAAGLSWHRCDAAPAIPALIKALKDPSGEVQAGVTMTLRAMGPRASSAAPALIDLLEKGPIREWLTKGRRDVAEVIAALGPQAVRQTLTRLLQKDFPDDIARTTIAAFCDSWSTVVPALLECLRDRKNPELRQAAAEILGQMNTEAASATPELFEKLVRGLVRALLEDPDPEVRKQSAYAFHELGKGGSGDEPVRQIITGDKEPMPTAVRALVKALGDRNADVRYGVVVALGGYYWGHKALALPALERAKNDPDQEVSRSARRKLKMIREKEELYRKARE